MDVHRFRCFPHSVDNKHTRVAGSLCVEIMQSMMSDVITAAATARSVHLNESGHRLATSHLRTIVQQCTLEHEKWVMTSPADCTLPSRNITMSPATQVRPESSWAWPEYKIGPRADGIKSMTNCWMIRSTGLGSRRPILGTQSDLIVSSAIATSLRTPFSKFAVYDLALANRFAILCLRSCRKQARRTPSRWS